MDEVENTPHTLMVMTGQSLAGQTEPTSAIPHPLVFYKHDVKEHFPLIAWNCVITQQCNVTTETNYRCKYKIDLNVST